MGGNITVKSVYGEGANFTLTIPQRIVDDTQIGKVGIGSIKSDTTSSISDVKYTGGRVLGVDDNKVNLKLISRIPAKYEMDVTLASC